MVPLICWCGFSAGVNVFIFSIVVDALKEKHKKEQSEIKGENNWKVQQNRKIYITILVHRYVGPSLLKPGLEVSILTLSLVVEVLWSHLQNCSDFGDFLGTIFCPPKNWSYPRGTSLFGPFEIWVIFVPGRTTLDFSWILDFFY